MRKGEINLRGLHSLPCESGECVRWTKKSWNARVETGWTGQTGWNGWKRSRPSIQSLRRWGFEHTHFQVNPPAGALPKEGDFVRRPAERPHVVPEPLQRDDDVVEAVHAAAALLRPVPVLPKREEPECA